MRSLKSFSTPIFVVIALASPPSSADWSSLLDDITTVGKELSTGNTASSETLEYDTIVSGLKEALEVGSKHAVDNISQPDGYLTNELIRISMPPELQQASDLMRQFGLNEQADQFEQSMNHAAEKAAPEATEIIVKAINDMSIEDANEILQGPDDAATEYFREKTSPQLTKSFRPAIEESLNQVGTTKYYNNLTDDISAIPFVGENVNLDLPDYVTEQALNGLFTVIAQEEKKIRENPAARTTELLKQVFGS